MTQSFYTDFARLGQVGDSMSPSTDNNPIDFYEQIDRQKIYTVENESECHPFYLVLRDFILKWHLDDKKCLEIGSSKGLFQHVVADYTGLDVAENLRKFYSKPYIVVDGSLLPFQENQFDAIFTYATHEHIPDIETALEEIVRVLKPGGVCLFAPAWHTRPWFAEGLVVRPYRDLSGGQKFRKLLIPLRDTAAVRWPRVLLRRCFRLLAHLFSAARPQPLRFRRLRANYHIFWQSDSDACNSLDPFDVILWFRSRGVVCHSYTNLLKALLVRTTALELQKPSRCIHPRAK